MRRLFLGTAAILLASCSSPAEGYNTGNAPEEFHGPATANVMFLPPADVQALCLFFGAEVPSEGMYIRACAVPALGLVVAPEPCLEADTDRYAKTLCHEKGHINGWKHD